MTSNHFQDQAEQIFLTRTQTEHEFSNFWFEYGIYSNETKKTFLFGSTVYRLFFLKMYLHASIKHITKNKLFKINFFK